MSDRAERRSRILPAGARSCGQCSRRELTGGKQRAVFVYQIEAYRHWQDQLKRTDFVHGQFGENFTIEGLPDDAVCIGDRYQIGSAFSRLLNLA